MGQPPGPRHRPSLSQRGEQIEAKLLAEVAAGRYQDAQGVKVAELVDRWLEWRQAVKPMSPGTAAVELGDRDATIRLGEAAPLGRGRRDPAPVNDSHSTG